MTALGDRDIAAIIDAINRTVTVADVSVIVAAPSASLRTRDSRSSTSARRQSRTQSQTLACSATTFGTSPPDVIV